MITKKAGEKHMAERRAEGRERNKEVLSRRGEGATGRGGETG